MVTIKEVAKVSGYSQATISRLFKGDETLYITSETKKRIIETALSLGYDRSKIKTTLEKIAILFWVSETQTMQDIYFRQLQDALKKYGKISNMELIFYTQKDDIKFISKDISGFIAVGSITKEELLYLQNQGYKGVLLEINPLPKVFDTVKPDTDAITREAIDFFINEGFSKIGFIGGKFHDPSENIDKMDNREYTFREYLKGKGLMHEEYIFSEGNFTVDEGHYLATKMVESLPNNLPQACLIASDTIAVGALQGFHEKGISLPNELAIISINDSEIAKFVSPPLTTYRIDTEEMAKTAIDLLSDQLVYPRRITKTVLLGAELIVRRSFVPTNE